MQPGVYKLSALARVTSASATSPPPSPSDRAKRERYRTAPPLHTPSPPPPPSSHFPSPRSRRAGGFTPKKILGLTPSFSQLRTPTCQSDAPGTFSCSCAAMAAVTVAEARLLNLLSHCPPHTEAGTDESCVRVCARGWGKGGYGRREFNLKVWQPPGEEGERRGNARSIRWSVSRSPPPQADVACNRAKSCSARSRPRSTPAHGVTG